MARDAVTAADWVTPPIGPAPAGIVEETERIADWLERPGVRLIEIDGDWCWPSGVGPSATAQLRVQIEPAAPEWDQSTPTELEPAEAQ